MSADRRTLVIGAVAMVVLVAIGVVSAQLFARGGCTDLPTSAEIPGPDDRPVATILDDVFAAAEVDGAAVVDALEELLAATVTDAVPVGDAVALLPTGDGIVAAGPRTTAFGSGTSPTAALELAAHDHLVGSGDTLFVLNVQNELTGQTDAVTPVAGSDLRVGSCLDTALVGAPFAFHLDADAGDLLLFRIEDDTEGPELELRDVSDGRVWSAALQLGSGSPGVLAERLSAGIGPDTVVAVRRTSPREDAPALVGFTRADGSPRVQIDAVTLAEAAGLDPGRALRFEVVAVGRDVMFLTGTGDDEDDPDDVLLVAVELDLGEPVGAVPLPGPVVAAEIADDRLAIVTRLDDDDLEVATWEAQDGQLSVRGRTGPSDHASVRWSEADVVVGMAGGVFAASADDTRFAELGLDVLDVLTVDGRSAVLLGGDDTDGTVVVFLTHHRSG